MTTKTETDRQPRLHNLADLKALIKANAAETRRLRDEAQKVTGMDRWDLQQEARESAPDQRYLLLAYGYLRGKTIEQMESPFTHPANRAESEEVLYYAEDYFMEGPEAPAWEKYTKTEVPVPDDRTFIGKALGRPAPKPRIRREPNEAPGWDEFAEMVRADIKQWNARLTLDHIQRQVEARKAVA